MADPYYRYASAAERDVTDPRASGFPGYLPSDGSLLASRSLWDGGNLRAPTEFGKNDILPLRSGDYGLDDFSRMAGHAPQGIGSLPVGNSVRAFTPLEDPALVRRDGVLGVKAAIADYERSELRKSEGLPADESNILFVDGLPNDCTRREVAHLFRPFIGFKEIRVVHKEARRSGDKAYVLCFVEFTDSKCALTAMEALQGYKFDDKKPDVLRIQFAKFPFHPASHDERRHAAP